MLNENVQRMLDTYCKLYPPPITPKDAATIARHDSLATIYDWSSRGQLDHIKLKRGRRVLFDLVGFIYFLAGQDGDSRGS